MFINGHFCYAYKFGIIINGLGLIRNISLKSKLKVEGIDNMVSEDGVPLLSESSFPVNEMGRQLILFMLRYSEHEVCLPKMKWQYDKESKNLNGYAIVKIFVLLLPAEGCSALIQNQTFVLTWE